MTDPIAYDARPPEVAEPDTNIMSGTRENGKVEYPNPFDWERPENIDAHPDRYNSLRDAIENILLTRLYQKRLEGYVLEVSTQIMDAVRLSTQERSSVSSQSDCQQQGAESELAWWVRDAANSICGQHGATAHQEKLLEAADALAARKP